MQFFRRFEPPYQVTTTSCGLSLELLLQSLQDPCGLPHLHLPVVGSSRARGTGAWKQEEVISTGGVERRLCMPSYMDMVAVRFLAALKPFQKSEVPTVFFLGAISSMQFIQR